MAAARITAYSHVASFFNVGGQKEKEKKRGGEGEMNVRNLKFPQIMFTNPYQGKLGWDGGSVLYLKL